MATQLPHQVDQLFITDGGLETTLIFHQGMELPHFAAFPLLETEQGRQCLAEYYRGYMDIAESASCGFIFETPTWRAHARWGEVMGYSAEALDRVNRDAIGFLKGLRETWPGGGSVISGCVGPRGDGYVSTERMTAEEARAYHRPQITSFAAAGADMVSAMTLNYPQEAIGVVEAARDLNIPAVISFTTETDGRMPDGTPLQQAIAEVDSATSGGPAYYMLNCAHPDHFSGVLERDAAWMDRIRGFRVNASRMSHAELDNSETLDDGNPAELGALCRELRQIHPNVNVLGGCCGTDHRHVGHMCVSVI